MAEDVAPRIRLEMESVITENNADRRKMTRLHVKAEKGQASFADANEYAGLRGKSVRKAIGEISASDLPNGQMYYNIATRTVGDALDEMVGDVLDVAESATKAANDAAGIGLKPIRPDMQDNIDRLVDKCTEDIWDNVKDEVSAAAETLSRKSVDETVVQNARFQAESGLNPKITRTESSGACQWCAERVGTYEYVSVRGDSDIFGRHANCDGVIEFHPGKGQPKQTVSSSSYRQNRDSLTPEERERRAGERATESPAKRDLKTAIREQASTNNDSSKLTDSIIKNHESLKEFTPEEMKTYLEACGYDILPLSKSKSGFSGVPFEDGGGYKILYGGDGIFRYHPAGGRHKKEYWKVSNGLRGGHSYGMDGGELEFRKDK